MVDIIRLHDDPHSRTQLLLPWYVNGTLDAAEKAEVEAHLADCDDCTAELGSEALLARAVADAPPGLGDFETLRRELERRGDKPAPAWRAGGGLFRRAVPLGWAMAAQFAAVAVMGGLLWAVAAQPRAAYHALGAAPAVSTGNVVVVLKPTTTELEMRSALQKSGARLVDGPTASDAYVLHVAADHRGAALARLKSDPHVVLAEPLDGDPQP